MNRYRIQVTEVVEYYINADSIPEAIKILREEHFDKGKENPENYKDPNITYIRKVIKFGAAL